MVFRETDGAHSERLPLIPPSQPLYLGVKSKCLINKAGIYLFSDIVILSRDFQEHFKKNRLFFVTLLIK